MLQLFPSSTISRGDGGRGRALSPCRTPLEIAKALVLLLHDEPSELLEKSSDHVPAKEERAEMSRIRIDEAEFTV